MPGIIFSSASGVNESVFGLVQDPLKAFIERENEAWMSKDMNLAPKIFHEFRLDTATGRIQTMGNLGEMEIAGENGAYPMGDREEGFHMIVESEEWKYATNISKTAMEDKLDNVVRSNGQDLMDAYYRTRNNFFWGLLGSAIQNKHYNRKGKIFSVNTMDGVKLFSDAHVSKFDKKLVQKNAFTDEFSATSLGKLATNMQNARNDNGEIMGLNPDTIIIPNDETAKAEVFGVVGAHQDPTTPGGNRYNYQFGNWNVMVVPWLVQYMSGNKFPYILMDSEFNKKRYGAMDVVRIDPTVESYIDNGTDANVWKIRTRFSGRFGEWRAFAAGGLDFGGTL